MNKEVSSGQIFHIDFTSVTMKRRDPDSEQYHKIHATTYLQFAKLFGTSKSSKQIVTGLGTFVMQVKAKPLQIQNTYKHFRIFIDKIKHGWTLL